MDFEQKNKTNVNEQNYHFENLRIVREFSKGLIKEMNELVKAIVVFGSNSTKTNTKNSDIDLMIILDNVNIYVSPELREAYRVIVNNLVQNISHKLHIMTVNFSDFWDMNRKGDPVLINILRTGYPIYDTGIIEPMQYLLSIGKIKPTRETVNNYLSRSETLLDETEKHLQNAVLDLYYATVDIVHASLMSQKIMPCSPKEMPEIFKTSFKGKYIEKHSKTINEIYNTAKKIEHGNIKNFTGKHYDELRIKVENMILDLKTFIQEELKKKDLIEL